MYLISSLRQQLIFYGPPGTGKTYVAQELAEYFVSYERGGGGHVQVVQFHPSYAYEDFIEGIRPAFAAAVATSAFELRDGMHAKTQPHTHKHALKHTCVCTLARFISIPRTPPRTLSRA